MTEAWTAAPAPPSMRHLKDPRNGFFSLSVLELRGQTCCLLCFHNQSLFHFTACSFQSKILNQSFYFLRPVSCLSVWLLSGDGRLSASCPSARLGCSVLLAFSSPRSNRPEHSRGDILALTHTDRAPIQTKTLPTSCVWDGAGSQHSYRTFLNDFLTFQRAETRTSSWFQPPGLRCTIKHSVYLLLEQEINLCLQNDTVQPFETHSG